MKIKFCFFAPLIIFVLISCVSAPLQTGAQVPSPDSTQVPSPTVTPTATINPEMQSRLAGVEAVLPSGGQAIYDWAWASGASGKFWSGVYVPYRMQNGVSLLALGQPRREDNTWDGKTQIHIWDWQAAGLEPMFWQEIRPVGRGQSSFLGRDQEGRWWAVMSRMNWDVPELDLLGIFPVPSLDGLPIERLGMYPTEELHNFQIENIGLYPAEDTVHILESFMVRENDHMSLYQMENAQARMVWSTDRVMDGRFHVHSYTDPGSSLDMTGDGREEILVVWDLNFPPLIDVYQIEDGPDILHWLGRFDSNWQYTDVTGDGLSDFLQPEEPEKPQAWQVITWNGKVFLEGEKLLFPQPVSPSALIIPDPENLPPLPSNLIFRLSDIDRWWRWSGNGGTPEELPKPPNHLYNECAPYDYGGYGNACYSPAGRFKLIQMPVGIEGSDTGILDGLTGNRVRIPDSFVYTEGYNTFAWSPDEKFLLFARGDGFARLAKVNPVSGESTVVWSSSLCGLDGWDCIQYGLLAITDPVVFKDGSVGFAFQSAHPAVYPPPGIYRLSPEGKLIMLTALPFIDQTKGISRNLSPSAPIYGYLLWSPDKSAFLYYDFYVGDKTGFRVLLLGKADGSALWDLREALPDVKEFRWE